MIKFSELQIGTNFRADIKASPICTKLADSIWGIIGSEDKVTTAERITIVDRPLKIKIVGQRDTTAKHLIQARAIIEYFNERANRTQNQNSLRKVSP